MGLEEEQDTLVIVDKGHNSRLECLFFGHLILFSLQTDTDLIHFGYKTVPGFLGGLGFVPRGTPVVIKHHYRGEVSMATTDNGINVMFKDDVVLTIPQKDFDYIFDKLSHLPT